MDEMRVASKFLCGIIARILQGAVKKCCGVKSKITLANVSYSYDENGRVNIHIKDFDITMGSKDFEKFIVGKIGPNEEE